MGFGDQPAFAKDLELAQHIPDGRRGLGHQDAQMPGLDGRRKIDLRWSISTGDRRNGFPVISIARHLDLTLGGW